MRSFPVSADYTAEIEVTLSATIQPGYPATGPSHYSAGEPGEGPCVEDVDVAAMRVERVERKYVRDFGGVAPGRFENSIRKFDILKGVDRRNPEVAKLIANLIEALGEDAESTLIEAAAAE